jgi:hypothetical protein
MILRRTPTLPFGARRCIGRSMQGPEIDPWVFLCRRWPCLCPGPSPSQRTRTGTRVRSCPGRSLAKLQARPSRNGCSLPVILMFEARELPDDARRVTAQPRLRIGPEGEVMAIRPSGAFRRCGGRRRARPHPSGPRSACGPASRWAGARAARAASRSPVSRPPSRMARWRAEKRSRTDQARAVARATGASPDAKTYASPGPSSPSASTRLPPQSAAAASGLRTSAVQTRSNGASAER